MHHLVVHRIKMKNKINKKIKLKIKRVNHIFLININSGLLRLILLGQHSIGINSILCLYLKISRNMLVTFLIGDWNQYRSKHMNFLKEIGLSLSIKTIILVMN